nr:hypothetical protein [uncultured Sphingobacterium sp.]
MEGYTIIDNHIIESNVKFLRINPTDIKLTLNDILSSFMDLCWLSEFDQDYLKESYKERANQSIEYISTKIFNGIEDEITSSAGEYVVSELARLSVVSTFSYLNVPLAELFKKQKVGNPGFDFYSANHNKHLLFGEAKYVAKQNGYGRSFSQVSKFYDLRQHIADLADIDKFFCQDTLSNCNNGDLGFMIAFSSKSTETYKLIERIKKNTDYQKLAVLKEIILIAVNI